jgi:hypothetical protein
MPTDAQMMASQSVAPSAATGYGDISRGYQLSPLQLPDTPSAQGTDSMYQAAIAALKYNTTQQYNDIRRQVGYTDDAGGYIPGLIETEAMRQADFNRRGINLAGEATTQEMQRAGTLFSGYRGTAQARNEYPYVQALADLDVKVPQQLADLYERAGGLSQQYVIGQNQLLAEASQRYLNSLLSQPSGGGGVVDTGGDGSGGGTGGDGTDGGTQPPVTPEPYIDPYLQNPSRPLPENLLPGEIGYY